MVWALCFLGRCGGRVLLRGDPALGHAGQIMARWRQTTGQLVQRLVKLIQNKTVLHNVVNVIRASAPPEGPGQSSEVIPPSAQTKTNNDFREET